jgi:hypothetical protein
VSGPGVLGSSGPTALWYLARATGIVTFVLLTVSVVLGVATSVRWSSTRAPRFVVELVHRNVSLLVLALIGVHVATVVLDAFAPISWWDAVIPFRSSYRPIWLGLGALALDLLLAITVTSLLRRHVGYPVWRVLHWFSYLCWPLVLVHGLATGSDTKLAVVLVIDAACVTAVLGAVGWRIAVGWSADSDVRIAALMAAVIAPVVLVVWLIGGPLADGWSRRAGTPAQLLGGTATGDTTPTSGAGR